MPSTIGERDLRQLAVLQRLLLTPPLPDVLDDWRAAIGARLRELTGADRSMFMLPNSTSVLCFAEVPYDDDISVYPAFIRSDWERFGLTQRALALEAFSRTMLYHPHERELYRTGYYNEVVVPARAYDSLSLTCRTAQNDDLVQLVVHHERPVGRKFGSRELTLMRLLFPAFAAGVAAYRALERRLAALPQLLDRDGAGICLFSLSGTLLHCNPRAAELLGARALGLELHVNQVVAALRVPRVATPNMLRPLVVRGPSGPITIRGSLLESDGFAPDPLVLVELAAVRPYPTPGADEVRHRFRLTHQQTRVALLLAERRTNAEIAHRLCISLHTVKRHVEQVLARVGVPSRNDVADALARPSD